MSNTIGSSLTMGSVFRSFQSAAGLIFRCAAYGSAAFVCALLTGGAALACPESNEDFSEISESAAVSRIGENGTPVFLNSKVANLYKTTPSGSIVINSTPVTARSSEGEAMKRCEASRQKFEASAEPGAIFVCRLEAI
jgi:hypothetical protein